MASIEPNDYLIADEFLRKEISKLINYELPKRDEYEGPEYAAMTKEHAYTNASKIIRLHQLCRNMMGNMTEDKEATFKNMTTNSKRIALSFLSSNAIMQIYKGNFIITKYDMETDLFKKIYEKTECHIDEEYIINNLNEDLLLTSKQRKCRKKNMKRRTNNRI